MDAYNFPVWFRKFCIQRINQINEKKEGKTSDNTVTPMPTKKGERIDGRFIHEYLKKNSPPVIIQKQEKQQNIKTPFSSGKRPNIPLPIDKK